MDGMGRIPVTIGARDAAHAGRSEALVPRTVKEPLTGSGSTFDDADEHELIGTSDRHLYRVVD
jgi:hypothetical protein